MRAYNNVQTTNGERPAHCLFSNTTVDCDMFFRADLFTFGSPLRSSFLGRRLRSNYNLVRISTFLFDGLTEAMSAKPQTGALVATLVAKASAYEARAPCIVLATGLVQSGSPG